MECIFLCVQLLMVCISVTSGIPPQVMILEPNEVLCLGDRVVFTCTSSEGVLAWSVDGNSIGTFIQASNPSVGDTLEGPGVSAILTAIDRNSSRDPFTYTSNLTIQSLVTDNEHIEIWCSGALEAANITLTPTRIDMVEAVVDSELVSASVTVTTTNITECVGMYVVMAMAVNGGGTVRTMSTSSPVEVTGLNLCTTNYNFTVVAQYRGGGNGPNYTVNNVQGDLTTLNPVTDVRMTPPDVLHWSPPVNLPSGCIIGYEIYWNGGNLTVGENILSVSHSTLMASGFPLCIRLNVSVAPILSSLKVFREKSGKSSFPLLQNPRNFAPPQNLRSRFVFIPDGARFNVNWTSLQSGIFGSNSTPMYTCTSDISGTRGPCDSNSSHIFTSEDSTILTKSSIVLTVAADFKECHVESSIDIHVPGGLQKFPQITVLPKSANVMLNLNPKFFDHVIPCIAAGGISTTCPTCTSVLVEPMRVHVTSQNLISELSFNFSGLNENTLHMYEYLISIICTNTTVEIPGEFTESADSRVSYTSGIVFILALFSLVVAIM